MKSAEPVSDLMDEYFRIKIEHRDIAILGDRREAAESLVGTFVGIVGTIPRDRRDKIKIRVLRAKLTQKLMQFLNCSRMQFLAIDHRFEANADLTHKKRRRLFH